PRTDGFKTWTADSITTFRAFYALGSMARLALELLLSSALRVSDVVKVGPGHIREGVLSIETQKTGMPVVVEIMPELEAAIAATPTIGIGTLLLNERGRPFTPGAFTKWFSQQAARAGLKGCTAHGLRKSALVRLAEAGATAPEIASVSGHASLKQVQR